MDPFWLVQVTNRIFGTRFRNEEPFVASCQKIHHSRVAETMGFQGNRDRVSKRWCEMTVAQDSVPKTKNKTRGLP